MRMRAVILEVGLRLGRKDTIFAGHFSYMQTLSRPASTVRLIFNRLGGDPVLLVSSSHPLPNATHNDLYLDASTPNDGIELPDGAGYGNSWGRCRTALAGRGC